MGQPQLHKNYSLRSLIGLADILTLFNALSGFLAILFALGSRFGHAVGMLVLSFIFDSIDGAVARKHKTRKESLNFGVQMDSLADIISFGVAPAIIVYLMIPSLFSAFTSLLYLSSGMIRLARFNILPLKGVFVGIPIPTIVLFLPLFFLLGADPTFYPWLLLFLSILMNLPIIIPKPKINRS